MFDLILEKYGIKAAIVVFLLKTLWDVARGTGARYIKALNDNTAAIDKLRADLRTAFYNIKELREKNGLGPISKPELDQ